jgi:hypothetical protein
MTDLSGAAPTLPSYTAPGTAPRQSLHFANRNLANSMKTIGQQKFNRYILRRINDRFFLRPQRLCGGFSVSNRNQNGFSGWPIPTAKTG